MSCTISDEAIMELVKDRGILKYTMLMLKFHISSVEAQRIVKDYVSRGIIDEDGRYGKKSDNPWRRFSPKKITEINSEVAENEKNDNLNDKEDTDLDEDGSQVSKESVPEKSAEERANTSENNPAANISMHQDTNGQLTFF